MKEKTIFKRIIDGEIPCYKIYEDNNFLVFLDILPEAPGHTLIIPKKEEKWVWDVELYDEYWQLARKIAKALQKAFSQEMIICKIVGEEVPHAHIKLFPAIQNDGKEKDFEINAKKIIENL
ncbi:MAG: histidine triad (HIT) family protein [Crocinitomicaceae bacterium]|jgi:histidine triad (HIT) family protein